MMVGVGACQDTSNKVNWCIAARRYLNASKTHPSARAADLVLFNESLCPCAALQRVKHPVDSPADEVKWL